MKPDIIKNAFTACDLYPFSPTGVNYCQCISTRRKNLSDDYLPFEINDNDDHKNAHCMNQTSLRFIKANILIDLTNSFKEEFNYNQDLSSEQLFFTIWKKLNTSIGLNVNKSIDLEL